MKLKWVGRFDPVARLLRLARVTWTSGAVGDGKGYSSKLSLALTPRVFSVRREWQSVIVTCLGVRLHHERSYGGNFD